MKPASLDTLTSLRFFAAAFIFLFHLQGPILPVAPVQALALGVSFFFVLSGFVLAYVYSGELGVRRFYIARLARLWPIHLVTLALTLALLIPTFSVSPAWWGALAANALLLQAWLPVPALVFSFNGVAWSISAELFFYLLFPLLVSRYRIYAMVAIALFTGALLLLLELWQPPLRGEQKAFSTTAFLIQSPLMRILEFAVGVATGRLFLRKQIETGTATEILCVSGAIMIAVASSHAQAYLPGLRYVAIWLSLSGGMLVFAALIYVFAHERGTISRILKWRPLVILGEISFATYMLHQIVLRYAEAKGWTGMIGLWPTVLVIVVLVYAGSYILWRFIETPSRAAIVELGARSFSKSESSPAVP